MGRIQLTGQGRRRILGGHPWIYVDDIAGGEGEPGELVPIAAPDDRPLGWGLFSTKSKIGIRLVTRSAKQPNRAFWLERVRAAVGLRKELGLLHDSGACRLSTGDAEGMPGFVVDRYADRLVVQSGCQGSDRMRDFLVELFLEVLPFEVAGVYERSDSATRKHEDLKPSVGWLSGSAVEQIEIKEPERFGFPRLSYEVSLVEGHKTGHYLDQRENRTEVARFADGKKVLDAFSYDGLFGIRAALCGAQSVLCLDQAQAAGERLLGNAERNGVLDRVRFEKVNAMHDLRDRANSDERFGIVVVDPPAFARNKREVEGAIRGYRELNRRAMSLVEPGGMLFSASCSFNIDRKTFVSCIAKAALDVKRRAKIFSIRGAAADHPSLANLPESEYLKAVYCRIEVE